MHSLVGAERVEPSSFELVGHEMHSMPSGMIQNTPAAKYPNERPAVSEVVGTLILVGVVLVGVAVGGTLLLSQPTPTEVPHFDAIISNQSETIHILHKGGDPLATGEYKILVDGTDRTSSFMNDGDDPWSVGETLSYTSLTMPQMVVIVFTGDGTGRSLIVMGSELHPVVKVPSQPPNPPSVDWYSSPGFGNTTTSFQFTDASTSRHITSYTWDFGDGTIEDTQSPAHTFPCNTGDSCLYSISHSATDSGGTDYAATTWLNRSGWVAVYKDPAPTAIFTQDRTVGVVGCFPVNFDATQTGAIKVDSWSWDFGDFTPPSTDEDPFHTYTTPGTYTVTLTATNFTLGQATVTSGELIHAIAPAWYNCGWLYRKNITLNGTAVPADLSNFPVLISYTDSDLSARALGNGNDILFTDAGGTNLLPYEIESYSNGILAAWVKVNPLTSGTNTTIYMYYGNSGASSLQDPQGVWDTNFKGVWHHTENFLDSTSNNNDGTNGGSSNAVSAKIAGARQYDGSNDYVDVGSGGTIDQIWSGGGTFSAWIYPTGLGGNSEGRIVDKTNAASLTYGWYLSMNAGNTLRFKRAYYTTSSKVGSWTTPAITMNAWNYVVVTYTDGTSNDPNIYINGDLVSETEDTTPSGSQRSDASYNLRFGNRAGGTNRAFNGIIDEIRASKTIRSPNWILAEYRNQASPALFHYTMTQETQAG
jgi:PKD repeat protein